jgi:hypothetical protein
MTEFVEIPLDRFDVAAFDNFTPERAFTLGTARALMWASQLGYETERLSELRAVLDQWGFGDVTPFVKTSVKLGAAAQTSGVYGERDNAVILVFGGTDPGIWETIATDANVRRTENTDVHSGFQWAFNDVASYVDSAIQLAKSVNKPIFLAGHSLGGALAALAAKYAATDGLAPCAVYTYGMPRVGGDTFCSEYTSRVGDNTYRLVYGDDIVPRVPLSVLGFHHVGRVLQCSVGSKFDLAAPLSVIGSDEPRLSGSILDSVVGHLGYIVSGQVLTKPGLAPGLLGASFALLPPEIRHHLQDCYFDALTPA